MNKKLSLRLGALVGIVVLGFVSVFSVPRVEAATPPDSCFAFDVPTQTITDYYDNEANDPGNPACPKAVDIPATIGGEPVKSIGYGAFYSSQLTSVTIPFP